MHHQLVFFAPGWKDIYENDCERKMSFEQANQFANDIKVFGHHPKDNSPQGIFCANGQCSACMVIVNGKPMKACMTPLRKNMVVESCDGLPTLPEEDENVNISDPIVTEADVLIIGAGPSGLAATEILAKYGLERIILIDDKDRMGGKLVLQTHKFFG